jgi:hypothetical protein
MNPACMRGPGEVSPGPCGKELSTSEMYETAAQPLTGIAEGVRRRRPGRMVPVTTLFPQCRLRVCSPVFPLHFAVISSLAFPQVGLMEAPSHPTFETRRLLDMATGLHNSD